MISIVYQSPKLTSFFEVELSSSSVLDAEMFVDDAVVEVVLLAAVVGLFDDAVPCLEEAAEAGLDPPVDLVARDVLGLVSVSVRKFIPICISITDLFPHSPLGPSSYTCSIYIKFKKKSQINQQRCDIVGRKKRRQKKGEIRKNQMK